jgi:murein DD-endopeptidase MepM/ murein hydrolase activator NlpD
MALLRGGVLVLLGLIAWNASRDWREDRLAGENHQLRSLLLEAESRLRRLELSVDSLHRSDGELRRVASLAPIPDEVRRMGVGGSIWEPWQLHAEDLDFGLLERMERETALLRESMEAIRGRIAQRNEELRHLPTMRPVLEGFISSRYGYREDPFTGRRRMHKGVDFQAPTGTPVIAPADGRVIQAGRVAGFGRVIKLDHGNDLVTVYGHLSKIHVKVGQNIERGERIGDVGSTGRSTSPHLHYEVRQSGRHVDPLNFILDEFAEIN